MRLWYHGTCEVKVNTIVSRYGQYVAHYYCESESNATVSTVPVMM